MLRRRAVPRTQIAGLGTIVSFPILVENFHEGVVDHKRNTDINAYAAEPRQRSFVETANNGETATIYDVPKCNELRSIQKIMQNQSSSQLHVDWAQIKRATLYFQICTLQCIRKTMCAYINNVQIAQLTMCRPY